MDELFVLENASLVLRLIHHLTSNGSFPLKFLTVIHEDADWIVRLKSSRLLPRPQEKDLDAFLWEIGVPCQPSLSLTQALMDLELGRSPVEVMQQYRVVVVSHGIPSAIEVEFFRRDFMARLGYCPCTLI